MQQPAPYPDRTFTLRYAASCLIWLVLPSFTLLVFRSTRWEALFRARPYNNSYDSMFIAAMAGIGLTSLWAVAAARRRERRGARPLPVWLSWRNAFVLFELLLSASLAVLNAQAGAPATAVVWTTAFLVLLAATVALGRSERETASARGHTRSPGTLLMSAVLVMFAGLFIAFPVLQPWSGPPEPFVRWHPFGQETELIWRGVFLSFAAGMLMAATDPVGRHRLFLVALVLSGYLHAAEMCADNLLSAGMGGRNGNPEHLYGDVLGWFVVATLALVFLKFGGKATEEVPADACG